MKKTLTLILILICINPLLSAQVHTDTINRVRISDRELGLQYLKKANRQRTTAWVMLGSGIAMEFIALSIGAEDIYSENVGPEVILVVGSLLTVASVPVFISGAKNRGRAEMLLRYENIRVYNNYGSGKEGIVALSLSIPLNRSRK